MRDIFTFKKIEFSKSRYKNQRKLSRWGEELYEVIIGIDVHLRCHFDIAIGYLEIAYIGQVLSENSEILKVQQIRSPDGEPCVAILLRSLNPDIVNEAMLQMNRYYGNGSCSWDHDCYKCDEEGESRC